MIELNNEKGFTLVEMLIVLFITFTLLIVSTSIFLKVKEYSPFEPFEDEMQLMLFETYAVAQKDYLAIMYFRRGRLFIAKGIWDEPIRELTIPEDITLTMNFPNNDIEFKQRGIDGSGTISMRNKVNSELRTYSFGFTYCRMRYYE